MMLVSWLYVFFCSLSQIFYFIFYIEILYGLRYVFWPKYSKKKELCKLLKPATFLKIVRSNCGLSGSMLLSHKDVLRIKRTGMTRSS